MTFASAVLGHRRIFSIAIALGMLFALISLRVGFVLDDYGFLAWLDGTMPRRVTPFNLYEFATGDRAANFEMVRRGPWPWWADLEVKVRFFRPLSSALLWLDHAAFGHAPLGYHLHNLVWYLLLLTGVGVLLCRVLSPRVFALAFLLYVVSGGHAETVGWISARHMLVGGAPAVWGLVAHIDYRERGFRGGRWLSVVGMLIGLLGSEAALGGLFFWIAYEALGPTGKRGIRERLLGVAVPLGIAMAYFLAYKTGGYGAARSDAYFEPLSDPFRFAVLAGERLPLYLGEMIGGTSVAFAVATVMTPFVVAGVLSLCAFAWLMRAVWRYIGETERRVLPWLGAGAVLATLVGVGGYPGARLLLLPGMAGYAFVATAILHIGYKLKETSLGVVTRGALRGARGFLVFVHLVYSPLLFVATVDMLNNMGKSAEIEGTLDPVLGSSAPPNGKAARVFVLSSSDPVSGLYVGAARIVRAPKTVDGWVTLSMARATHRIERTGRQTLLISADPGLLHGSFEVVFRSADHPLHVGERIDLDDVSVEIVGMQGHYPTSFEVTFRTISIDDPAVVLLVWRDKRLEPVHLAIGERLDVPWTPGPTGFF